LFDGRLQHRFQGTTLPSATELEVVDLCCLTGTAVWPKLENVEELLCYSAIRCLFRENRLVCFGFWRKFDPDCVLVHRLEQGPIFASHNDPSP
jgi:hypothetical protein